MANLTGEDARAFLWLAGEKHLHIEVTGYALGEANETLADLREGKLTGASMSSIH